MDRQLKQAAFSGTDREKARHCPLQCHYKTGGAHAPLPDERNVNASLQGPDRDGVLIRQEPEDARQHSLRLAGGQLQKDEN